MLDSLSVFQIVVSLLDEDIAEPVIPRPRVTVTEEQEGWHECKNLCTCLLSVWQKGKLLHKRTLTPKTELIPSNICKFSFNFFVFQ